MKVALLFIVGIIIGMFLSSLFNSLGLPNFSDLFEVIFGEANTASILIVSVLIIILFPLTVRGLIKQVKEEK